MNRSIVYIDGLNLYCGALKGTPNKWLDFKKYFELLRQADEIQKIKYFTAKANSLDQDTYLSALSTFSIIEIILGKFKDTTVKCNVSACRYRGDRWFNKPEEKRTDVNIAIHILHDVISDKCDRIVLVSGDSDLVPALEMVKRVDSSKKIILYVPAPAGKTIRGAATELRNIADKHSTLPNILLSKAQLPAQIRYGQGGVIHKPPSW